MTIAAKHLDPIVGVDVHIILIPTPAGPVPTPIPNPYVGMVFDPFDYVPIIGATVYVNGLPRAQAGTGGIALVPHLPLGGPFGPPPPTNESEVFMGSASVAVDGDAQSHLGLPVLSCQSVGMPPPFRPKGAPPKSMVLPTSVVLSIPMGPPVLIGGPPTISLMALGFRAGLAGLGRLGAMIRRAQRGAGRFGRAMRAITARARRAGDALADALRLGPRARNRINRAICTVTGHPVDVATGKVFTEKVDFEVPSALPFKWERVWYSTSTYRGPLGHGWHHPYDAALYVAPEVVLYRAPDGRLVSFPPIAEGEEHFDRAERLTLVRDAQGYSIREANAPQRTYRFRDVGRPNDEHVLVEIRDLLGNALRLLYDRGGALVEIRDDAGRSFELVHDRNGRITALTAPHPNDPSRRFTAVAYAYDAVGNLVEVVDALGRRAQYRYDGHLLVRETDRNGLSFYFQYDRPDEHARCLRTWGDGGIYDHKLRYDDGVTVVENSLGHTTTYKHRNGLVYETIDALGGVTKVEHDEYDEVLAEVDALGQRTESEYDARGNLVRRTTPDGASFELEYDAADRLVRGRDPLGGEWTWGYDAQGRLVEHSNPLGETSAFEWLGPRLVAVVDAAGNRTVLGYDGYGNLARLVTPDGMESGWAYDALGRVWSSTDPNGNVRRIERDLLGRPVRVHEPDGNVRELVYDGEGNLLRSRDRLYDVGFSYQGMGRLAARTQAGTTVRFEYDTEEQLVAIHNEHGAVYRFVLDACGNVVEEHGFDGLRRVYERDAAGRVTRVRRPGARETRYGYDAVGRIVAVEHGDGSKERYAYSPNGDLVEATNDAVRVAFERDPLGRIVKEIQGDEWVASVYDRNGRRQSLRSSKGVFQTIRRNAMGDVLSVEATLGPSGGGDAASFGASSGAASPTGGGFRVEFSRDRLGLEIDRALPGGIRAKWQRDRLGRPVRQDVFRGARSVSAKQYVWDVEHRLQRVIDAMTGPVQYMHDALGNLAAAVYADGRVELRMPDAVGNLFRAEQRTDRKYGPAGQLLEAHGSEGVTRYEYDPEGNLVAKHDPDGGTWIYHWNGSGLLERVIRPDGRTVEFTYDALGRRISKCYRDKITRWVWDGNVPLHEWVEAAPPKGATATGDMPALTPELAALMQRRRAAMLAARPAQGPPEASAELDEKWLGTPDAPITWIFEPESFAPLGKLVAGEQFGIVTDHLGTPTSMFDGAGHEVWGADIDTYGELRNLRGPRAACPFRWPGQYEDPETGLYYNRYRYYDSTAGGYVSQDPVRLSGAKQLYGYVSEPLIEVDPVGLMPWAAPTAQGHHLVPHSAASYLGVDHFDSQYGVPSFYFEEPYQPGSHERLHGRAGDPNRPALTERSVRARGLDRRSWMDSLRRNYFRPEIQDIRGDVRI
ncbi:MAG: DUF6531 domain-containing protein, partial [Pseudomonadota bacterium]